MTIHNYNIHVDKLHVGGGYVTIYKYIVRLNYVHAVCDINTAV